MKLFEEYGDWFSLPMSTHGFGTRLATIVWYVEVFKASDMRSSLDALAETMPLTWAMPALAHMRKIQY